MYPAWLWGPKAKPHHRYIGAAHEQGLAIRDNRLMRELVTSDWYQRLWPLAMMSDQNEKMYFENESRGFRQACAVKSMTGRRGHTVAWDDPLSPEKAHSVADRETALRVLSETLPTRLNDPITSAIIIVMQRLHEDDPSGYILREGLGYEHLCLPMEFEPKRACVTSIGFKDPRTEEGELLFPDRFPREVVDRDKKAMGSFATAGQFQQRPDPEGGGIFKDEWVRHWSIEPDIDYLTIYADTAQKTGQENDYSVFQLWAKGKDKRIYLIDMIRGKWEAPQLLAQAQAFWDKHRAKYGSKLRKTKVEDKSSGTGLIQQFRQKNIPVEGIPRDRDKISRAYDTAPQVEAGNVLLPESHECLSDLLGELSKFPMASHDDTVDPLMDAVQDMLNGKQVIDKPLPITFSM